MIRLRRLPAALAAALLIAAPAVGNDPGSFFRFKEVPVQGRVLPRGIAFSHDGKLMAAAEGDTIGIVETATARTVARVQLPRRQQLVRLAFTPDGKALVSDGSEDTATRFWDPKTGKQLKEQNHPKARWRPGLLSPVLVLDARGERMVCRGTEDSADLRVYEVATGKFLAALEGTAQPPSLIVFSPDSRLVAFEPPVGGLTLYDAATGKKVREIAPGNGGRLDHFATFSPDGKYVAAGESDGRGGRRAHYLTVWRVADGRRCARVETVGNFTSAAFGKDGRTLAATGSPHGFYLYDLANDDLVLSTYLGSKLRQPFGVFPTVVGSPDGSTLAVAIPVGNAESIHVTPFPKLDEDPFVGEPTAKELAECWEGIVGDNEFRREHEVRRLRSRPALAVEFVRTKVKPVPDLYRRRAADLVENLAAPDVRDKVTEDLRFVAHEFEPLLEESLKKAPPGDVHDRLAAAVKRAKETPPPPRLAAELRAVEVLEQLGTPAARKALEELAAGAAGAKVTAEAAAARKRVDDRLAGQ